MAGIDLNRTSTNVLLPKEVSSEIWANTQEESLIMRLAQNRTMPGAGLSIQTITGDAVADWVDETDEKPVSRATLGQKTVTPYKLAVIEPFSDEFRRDLPGLYAELARRLPNALAKKLDETVFHGTAPGSGFDVLSSSAGITIDGTNTYSDFLSAVTAVGTAGGRLSGWALSPQAEALAMGVLDGMGRPLFIPSVNDSSSVGSILGRPIVVSKTAYNNPTDPAVDTLGFAGDWSAAFIGTVEGVKIDVSNQATLTDGATTLNLWQRNMFAIRAEVEVAFWVKNPAYFVKLQSATATAP